MDNLNKKTLNSVLWNIIDVIGTKVIVFIVGIVLARILEPEDFGLIAMANIFISFGQVFLISGFISALVQRKDLTDLDYSSVFYVNVVFGLILYILFFFAAVPIANFFKQEMLVLIIRILSLNIIINSLFIVQFALVMKRMNFRRLAIIDISAALIAGTLAIISVYNGMGVWAVVVQIVANSLCLLILFWAFTNWYPLWKFSKERFLLLYNYALKLFLRVVVKNVFDNSHNLIIGKFYSIGQLGFYSKAYDLQKLTVNTLYQMVSKVSFSYFAKVQDDEEQYRKSFQLVFNSMGFVVMFLITALILNAEEIIILLLTDKWQPATPFFILLLSCGYVLPLSLMISNVLDAKGYAGLTLKIELIEKILIIVGIILTIKIGISELIISLWIALFCSLIIKIIAINRILKSQLWDFIGNNIKNFLVVIFIATSINYFVPVEIWLENLISIILVRLIIFTTFFIIITALIESWPIPIVEVRKYFIKILKK